MIRRSAILLCALLLSVTASGTVHTVSSLVNVQREDARRYTANPDGILSPSAVDALDTACDSLRRKGVAQISVVVVDDIDPADTFTFAHRLFSEWGVGSSSSSNGLGILLSTAQREIRFVTGDGLEGIMTDAVAKRIQQQFMVEPFSRGDYDTGLVKGMEAVASVLSGGEITDDNMEYDPDGGKMVLLAFTLTMFFFVLLVIVIAVASTRKRCPSCGKRKMKAVKRELIATGLIYDIVRVDYLCKACGHRETRDEKVGKNDGGGTHAGGPRGGFYGGFGGGSFGGGHMGGGFGGGHFGGGGAGSRF